MVEMTFPNTPVVNPLLPWQWTQISNELKGIEKNYFQCDSEQVKRIMEKE